MTASLVVVLAAMLASFLYAYHWVPTTAMRLWVISFAFQVMATLLALAAMMSSAPPAMGALRWGATGLAAVYMLFGALAFASIRRPPRERWAAIALVAIWAAIGAIWWPDRWVTAALILAFVGLSHVTAGYVIWLDGRRRHLAGAGLVSVGLILWGFHRWILVFIREQANLVQASSLVSIILGISVAVGILVMVMAEGRYYLQSALDDVASLVQRTQTQAERFSALSHAASRISITLDRQQLLQDIVLEGMDVLDADRCALYLITERTETVTCPFSHGLSREYVEGMIAQVQSTPGASLVQTGKPLLVEDAPTDPAYAPFRSAIEREGFRSIALFPLQHEATVIGALALYYDRRRQFGEDEVKTGVTFAQLAASAIVHSRLYARERQRASELEALREVTMQLTRSLDLTTVLETVANRARESIHATDTHLFVYDAESQTFSQGVASWSPEAKGRHEVITPRSEGLTATVARNGSQIIINQVADHPLFQDADKHGWTVRSIASFPLKVGDRVVGVLNAAFEKPHSFTESEVRLLAMLADNAAVAIDNAHLYRDLEELNRTLEQRVQVRTQELQTLLGLSENLARVLNRDDLMKALTDAVRRLLDCPIAACLLCPTPREATLIWQGPLAKNAQAPLKHYLRMTFLNANGRLWRRTVVRVHKESTLEPGESTDLLEWPLPTQIHASIRLHGQTVGLLWTGRSGDKDFSLEEEQYLMAVAQQANNALARLEAVEMHQRSRLQAILDSTPDGLLLLDEDGHVEVASPTAQEMLSLLADVNDRGQVERLGGHALQEIVRTVQQEGVFETEAMVGPHPLVFNLQARPVREREKPIPGLLVRIADMTRERHTQEQLFQTSKLASVGELAAGVAHEINNPLTAVVGFSEMLLRRVTEPDSKEMVERIFSAGQRTRRIVQNLLHFSRGLQTRELTKTDINEVVGQTVGLVRRQMELSGLTVVEQYDRSLPYVTTDVGGVGQIILNLLQNAHDAIRDSGTGGTVIVRTHDAGPEQVEVQVEDDGPGISAEIRSRIFDPFFTTKPPGYGTGLGLSISHRVARELGGQLSVRTAEGIGTTFTLRLPVTFVPPKHENGPTASKREADRPEEFDLIGRRVLIVDDESLARDIMQQFLASVGAEVTTLVDGQSALTHLLEERADYDLISLDIKMPGLDGIDLYKRLMNTRPELAQRVIFVTGDIVSQITADFLEISGRPALSKPFNREELLTIVQKVILSAAE